MPGPLEGRVAAVTGASSGIGAATARALMAAGATVAVAGRRAERLDADLAIACDLAVPDEAQAFVKRAHDELGRLDILVNCAGCLHAGAVATGKPGDWREMTEVNLLAAVNCAQAAIPAVRERGSGHIVNVSSVVAKTPLPDWSVYGATKAALSAFTTALRAELLPAGIRVTLVEPGFTATEMTEAEDVRPIVERLSSQRGTGLMQPEDVADAILFALTRPDHMTVEELVLRPFRAER